MVEAATLHMLRLAAEWTGSNPDEVSVTFNRDFIEKLADPKAVDAWVKTWMAGGMSGRSLHENVQRGELIPADRSYEDERELIEQEGGGLPVLRLPVEA